jgi:hypothetical protein
MTDRERLEQIKEIARRANTHAIELAIARRKRTGEDGAALVLCGELSVLWGFIEGLEAEMEAVMGQDE